MVERHKCFLLVWKGVCRFFCTYRKNAEKLQAWAGRDFPTRTQCTAGRRGPRFLSISFPSESLPQFEVMAFVGFWFFTISDISFYSMYRLLIQQVFGLFVCLFVFCQLKHLWAAIFCKEPLSWQDQKSCLWHFSSVVPNRRGLSWLLRVGLLWSSLSRGYGRV